MRICALVSSSGGSGRSTLCAQIATLYARRGREVLALDLDPANSLALHLGLPLAESDGWALRAAAGERWHEAAFRNSDGVRLLPFGQLDAAASDVFERTLAANPGWLRHQLETLALPHSSLVLIDTPRLPARLASLAMETADLLLHVLAADSAACASLPRLQAAAGRPLLHVANRVESGNRLQGDVLQLLRQHLGERLAPGPVHHDAAVAEAVALNLALDRHAPHAQATHDLQGLASWLLPWLEPGQ